MKSTEKVSSQKKDDAFTIMDEDEVDNDDFHSTESTAEQRNSKPKVIVTPNIHLPKINF